MEWFDLNWTWTEISGVFITIVFGGLLTLLIRSINRLTKKVSSFIETQDVLVEAVRNIIKTLIVIIHDDATDNGYIGRYKLDVSERLFSSYEKLHGNSYVEDLMNDLRNLPHGKKRKNELKK